MCIDFMFYKLKYFEPNEHYKLWGIFSLSSASCLATIQQQTEGLAGGFPRPQLPTFLAVFSTLCSAQKWSRFHCVPDLMAYFWSVLVSMDRVDSMALWTGRGHCCPAFKNADKVHRGKCQVLLLRAQHGQAGKIVLDSQGKQNAAATQLTLAAEVLWL